MDSPRTLLRLRSAAVGAVLALVATLLVAPGTAHAATTTYTADDSIFPNPERGFRHSVDIMELSASEVQEARSSSSSTLLHSYVRLDAFRTSDIDQATLDRLSAGLATARANGAKVILRAAYNFGPYPDTEPDASEAWIARHLEQLVPVLAANADVIVFLEAGFIGAWGEWHTSTNGHDTSTDAKVRILKNILAAAPNEQVALRYPSDVRIMQSRLGASDFSRIGSHQDCYGASDPGDMGTWGRDGSTPEADKALVAAIGVNAFVGGETCGYVNTTRADCETALAEMPAMHFTQLNIDYEPTVIQGYRDGGCFATMQRSFGYRLGVTTATYPTSVSPGGALPLEIGLTNSGWASVINPRPVFAVLDGPGGRFPIALSADPRTWESGKAATISQTVTVPSGVPAGTYRLALWLPDEATTLRSDPRYSIRLANTGTWDAATGLNVLATGITVGGAAPSDTTAPTTPTAVRATVSGSSATVTWDASSDPAGGTGVTGYEVLRGGSVVGTVGPDARSFTQTGLPAGTSSYTVRAVDGAGNRSAPSAAATVTVTTGTSRLVLDDYDGTPACGSGTNDLGRWTGANSFANGAGAGVVSGGALRLQYSGTGWFGSEVARDLSDRSVMVVRVRGLRGGEQNHIGLSIGGVSKRLAQYTTSSGARPVITTSSQDIRIPLLANGINRATPGQVALSFWHGGASTVWIDEIRFE